MLSEKKVVENISNWLTLYDDGSVDRTWTGPPEAKFMAEPVPTHHHFVDGIATKDVTIDPSSGLRVRIYIPEQNPQEKKLPIVLHFHGGGFCISQADWYMYYYMYCRLAKSAKAIVVSVYLPNAPEHRLPAACEDGFSGLLWLRSLAKGEAQEPWIIENGDFNRVFLVGDSSGGNLVHHVAARVGHMDLSPVTVAGGVLIHPGFVRAERSKSELEKPESPILTLDMIDKLLKLALPIGSTKDHPITCPMGPEAPPLEGLNLPPFLVCIAEDDLMCDTQMEYYEAMKNANKDVELLVSPSVGHCFYLNKIAVDFDPNTAAQTAGIIDGAVQFIRKH